MKEKKERNKAKIEEESQADRQKGRKEGRKVGLVWNKKKILYCIVRDVDTNNFNPNIMSLKNSFYLKSC